MLRTAPCISGQKGNNIGGPRKKSRGWAGIPSRKSEYTSQDEDNDDDDEDEKMKIKKMKKLIYEEHEES